jgi:hypothetical protein
MTPWAAPRALGRPHAAILPSGRILDMMSCFVRVRRATRAPRGDFSELFAANFGRTLGSRGQKRLRNAREHTQETLGARRPWPPADCADMHGSRRRPRGQRARVCVRDRYGSGGVPKRLFREPAFRRFAG